MHSIYDYTDYRLYLRDFYAERKATGRYTQRDFSRDAGMNSSAWLFHLIRGTKNLSEASIPRVCAALGLGDSEKRYFRLLVLFTQARTASRKNEFYRQLIGLKQELAVWTMTDAQYDYYLQWYHPVVRSLVSKVDFGDDYNLLGRRLVPAISGAQARASVRLLERLGFIERGADGRWRQRQAVVTTGDEVDSLNVVNYHRQVSKLAADVYDRTRRQEREISALTMGIGEAEFRLIKERLVALRKEIIEIVRSAPAADRVYQLNLQLFPVSRTGMRKERRS